MAITLPASPTDGQITTLAGRQYIYSSTDQTWSLHGGLAMAATAKPTSPKHGEIYFNPVTLTLEVFISGSGWAALAVGSAWISQSSVALTASPTTPSFTGIPFGVTEIKIMAPSLAAFSGGDFPCFQLGSGAAVYSGNTYAWSLNGDFGNPPQQDFGQNNGGDNKFVIYPANNNDALFVDITLMKLSGNTWQQTTIFNSNAGSNNVTSGTVQGTVTLPGDLDGIYFIASSPSNGLYYGNTPNPHDTNINVFYR